MKNKQEIIHHFFKGKCSVEELHEAYRLFGTREFQNEVLNHLENEWRNFDEKNEVFLPADFDNLYETIRKKNGIKQGFTFSKLKIAASIALICTFSLLTIWQISTSEYLENALSYNEVTTERGETKLIQLSDGSEILLNAASTVRYPKKLTREERNIHLEGSAYFQVKDQLSSLLVLVDEISAEVSGASFNVSAYADDDKITIAVKKGGSLKTTIPLIPLLPSVPIGSDANENSIAYSNQTLIVNESEYFSYNKTIRHLEHERFENPLEHFAWVDDIVFFEEVGMEKMLKQLSRTFDLDFDLTGCIDKKATFSGKYNKNYLTDILSQTSTVMNAEYTMKNRRITITGNCNGQF